MDEDFVLSKSKGRWLINPRSSFAAGKCGTCNLCITRRLHTWASFAGNMRCAGRCNSKMAWGCTHTWDKDKNFKKYSRLPGESLSFYAWCIFFIYFSLFSAARCFRAPAIDRRETLPHMENGSVWKLFQVPKLNGAFLKNFTSNCFFNYAQNRPTSSSVDQRETLTNDSK